MAWNIKGEFIESCSCNVLCPCWYGVQELMLMDKGYCATPWLIRIAQGHSDGVDLSGCKLVLNMFFPGPTLYDGNGTARLHIDEKATEDQRRELEAIFTGKRGGPMEVPTSLLSTWLPTQYNKFDFTEENGTLSATIGTYGTIVSRPLVNDAGGEMTFKNAGFAVALQLDDHTVQIAPSDGSSWSDSDMPEASWETKSGTLAHISWSVS